MTDSTIQIRGHSNPAAHGSMNFVALLPSDATGTIYWYVDQAYITSNGLSGANGVLSLCSVTVTPAGDHLVIAVYGGDTNYSPSSAVIVQTAS
jgi:hypothetical protein